MSLGVSDEGSAFPHAECCMVPSAKYSAATRRIEFPAMSI